MLVTIETFDYAEVDPQDIMDAIEAAGYFVERVTVVERRGGKSATHNTLTGREREILAEGGSITYGRR